MNDYHRWQGSNLQLFVHCQPGASREAFCGRHGDRLKITLRAVATEGKANKALIDFVAREFGVRNADVTLATGTQSRQKTLIIHAPSQFPAALEIRRD